MDETFLPPRPVMAHLCEGYGVAPLPQEGPGHEKRTWEEIRGDRPLNSLHPVAFALDVSSAALGSAICNWGPWTVAVSILGFIPLVDGSATTSARAAGKTGDYASSPARQDGLGFEVGVRYLYADAGDTTVDELMEKSRRIVNDTNDEAVADEQRRQKLPEMILETLRSVVDRAAYGSSVLCVTALIINGAPLEMGVGVCALNALSLALGRARVQTRGFFGAAMGFIVQMPSREPVVCLDLDEGDQRLLARMPGTTMTVCVLCALRGGAILYMEVHGRHFHEPLSQRLLRLVCNASEAVSEEIRTCVETNARTDRPSRPILGETL